MAKQILTGLDLLALPSLTTPKTGNVGFGAKSDGLYQKIGTVETKLSTTAELLDRVKTVVPLNAKFTDTVYTHPTTHPYSMITGAPTSLPANGGDSATVNGKTVEENVPAGAKFTDTIYSLPTASASVLGGIKVGSLLTISSGVLSANVQSDNNFTSAYKTKLDGIAAGANNYSLPTASSTTLGGVKIGSNISISSGIISVAAPYTHPTSHPISFITGLQSALDGKSNTDHSHSWSQITSKPSTFTPSAHTHTSAQITDFPTTWAWGNLTGVPSTFTPSSHSHSWSEITSKPSTFAPSAHTHTFASLTSKPTTLSGFGITDAYTKAEVNSLASYVGWYSASNGFLVKTDVARTENSMLVLHIKGNSYGGLVPINTFVQVYNYVTSDAIINTGALNNGYKINEVKAFYYNNLVYFWVPQQTGYMTMTFQLLKFQEQVNRVASVSNSAVPTTGVEKMVTITPRTAWFENTLTNVSQLSNDSGYITASASITGNAATATKLGTATVGSTQLPFYLNAGTATAITQANLRIGLFGTTAIGSATKPIYINTNGVPTASTSFGGVTGIGTASPLMDGTVAVGTSTLAARQDHRHPVDTSRAAVGQTMYIGTTAVAINRASATLNLTGIGSLAMSGALSVATTITATTSVKAPKVSVGSNWSLELSGTELQIKYGGVVKQRMLSDGSFVAEGGVSALGEGTGGSTGTSYERLDSWANYAAGKEGWVLSALLGMDLYNNKADKSNFKVVTSLPTSPVAGVFYFVKE